MNNIIRLIPLLLGMLLGILPPGLANATTFGTYDPRSLAMGGTGVSQANIDHAAYYNPALLSVAQDDDDFSSLVTLGARAYDPDKLLEAIQDHQDGNYETTLDESITTFQSSPTQANAALVGKNAQTLKNSYLNISGKTIDLEAQLGAGIAIPSKGLGFAVTYQGRAMAGIVLNISAADDALMQEYINAANDLGDNGTIDNGPYPNAICGIEFCSTSGKLTSTASVRGALVLEGGVSLSHEFESLANWSIGITPKTVQVNTYDYIVPVENSEIDEDKGKLEYEDSNIDIGIAKRISEGWKFGMVVKNAVKKEYKTVLGNTIVLEPAARMGVSHHTNWTTLALDVDLTENDRIGLTGEKTQYAAMGMEFDLSLLQLRIGGRHNMSAEDGRNPNMLTAGVGLYIFGFHADLAYAKGEDEVAAALQLGFQF